MLNYCFLWAQALYNISLETCFLDCVLSNQIPSWTNNDISKRMLFLLFPTILTKNFQIWDDGNQEHLWYLTRVGFSWRWVSSQSSAFSSFSPPSPFQSARGKAPLNMVQLQEMVSHDVFVFVLSLILVFVFVLDFVFNIAMICNYHKLEQYLKRLMNLSNPNILFYENIKYPADS